ncbi:MAG TPA: universal stress protein [Actinophytocola sp.]|uniref:universal stress protein n=1 Tax=Actinophytocola sp. TaxID=1872138 RepID=UPI002DBC916E|nr:universal stress protein [Actinophytocola sp.]HEU5469293.1 universal stress protein [Actinophytocola sp.]
MRTPPIVVGIDGTPAALRAARWAATEALRRDRPLRLVHTYEISLRFPAGIADPNSVANAFQDQGWHWLRAAEAAVLEVAPGLCPELALLRAPVVLGLLHESNSAEMLVLGTRAQNGLTGLLVGSVSVALAGRAHCPVVVARGRCEHDTTLVDGPVVVGVDGTPGGEAALAFAFEHAATHGRALVAVHTWTDSLLDAALTGAAAVDFNPLQQHAYETLAERLAGWQEKYPEVKINREVVQDRPAQALLRYAGTAGMVVVGTRGRGGFRGLVLGSTSQQLIYHAPCPVAVVRTDPEEEL